MELYKIAVEEVKKKCVKYQDGWCLYYECKCEDVNYKCDWEDEDEITYNDRANQRIVK